MHTCVCILKIDVSQKQVPYSDKPPQSIPGKLTYMQNTHTHMHMHMHIHAHNHKHTLVHTTCPFQIHPSQAILQIHEHNCCFMCFFAVFLGKHAQIQTEKIPSLSLSLSLFLSLFLSLTHTQTQVSSQVSSKLSCFKNVAFSSKEWPPVLLKRFFESVTCTPSSCKYSRLWGREASLPLTAVGAVFYWFCRYCWLGCRKAIHDCFCAGGSWAGNSFISCFFWDGSTYFRSCASMCVCVDGRVCRWIYLYDYWSCDISSDGSEGFIWVFWSGLRWNHCCGF